MNSIIARIDDFLRETVISQYVSYPERKGRAEMLLAEAKAIFPTVSGEFQKQLKLRIDRLEKRLLQYRKEDIAYRRPIGYPSLRAKRLKLAQTWLLNLPIYTLSVSQKITRTRQFLENLRAIAISPTPEEKETISKLEATILELKAQARTALPKEPEPPIWDLGEPLIKGKIPDIGNIVGIPKIKNSGDIGIAPKPPVLLEAIAFFRRMKDRGLLDETSLGSAIKEGERVIGNLNSTLNSMSTDQYNKWQDAFNGAEKHIGELVTKWKNQIKQIKKREATAKSEAWQKEKAREKTRTYVASKEKALVLGKTALDYTKAVQDAIKEAKVVLSTSQMIRSKVAIERIPEALPISDLTSAIASFEFLLARVNGRVPVGVLYEAKSKLDDLKRELKIVEKAQGNLAYDSSVRSFLTSRSSEGIAYFRANLPEGVKKVLPARDIAKLESMASEGVNGAKDAIAKAIYLVAKRSTERAREILGRK